MAFMMADVEVDLSFQMKNTTKIIYTHVCMYACMHACMYVYIYIY